MSQEFPILKKQSPHAYFSFLWSAREFACENKCYLHYFSSFSQVFPKIVYFLHNSKDNRRQTSILWFYCLFQNWMTLQHLFLLFYSIIGNKKSFHFSNEINMKKLPIWMLREFFTSFSEQKYDKQVSFLPYRVCAI